MIKLESRRLGYGWEESGRPLGAFARAGRVW